MYLFPILQLKLISIWESMELYEQNVDKKQIKYACGDIIWTLPIYHCRIVIAESCKNKRKSVAKKKTSSF